MSIPNQASTRFTEHAKYAAFLASLNRSELAFYLEKNEDTKENQFFDWLEDIEMANDFKNLVPMNIRMNTEEWNWFKARLEEEYTETLPNLRALVKCPPKAFKDLD